MIYHLNGSLSQISEEFIVIDVNGIGYQVFVPESVHQELPPLKSSIKVFTHSHIREDGHTLFGFLKMEDREFFIVLTSVSGVGPKVGMKILSTMSPEHMIQAIVREDVAVITQAPGVGKKMAERIILDLKDKLPKLYQMDLSSQSAQPQSRVKLGELENDLIMAMKTLGYNQEEIRKSIQKAADQLHSDIALEQGIKILLKHLI